MNSLQYSPNLQNHINDSWHTLVFFDGYYSSQVMCHEIVLLTVLSKLKAPFFVWVVKTKVWQTSITSQNP